tara:strand:- start:25577 stop:27481 length:1905 start_codon:yes stop_codon:yes gene_type:complete
MCGLSGIIVKNKIKDLSLKDKLTKMTKIISHRGPDQAGFIEFENILLSHVRLSVLDPRNLGRQPMSNDDRYVIIFNGEIYNYAEIKKILTEKGHRFYSNTDTEVCLNSFKEWGVECFKKFNGDWVIGILDKLERKFIIAKDQIGSLPLYIHQDEKLISFSSEIKGLQGIHDLEFDNDFLGLSALTVSAFHGSKFKNVFQLKPGNYLKVNLNNNKIERVNWFNVFSNLVSINPSYKQNQEEIFERLYNATHLRLNADIKVGTSLSGGLDSSIIFSILNLIEHNENLSKQVDLNPTIVNYEGNLTFKEAIELSELHEKNYNFFNSTMPVDVDHLINLLSQLEITDEYNKQLDLYREQKKLGIHVSIDGHGADEFSGMISDIPMLSLKFYNNIVDINQLNYNFKNEKNIKAIDGLFENFSKKNRKASFNFSNLISLKNNLNDYVDYDLKRINEQDFIISDYFEELSNFPLDFQFIFFKTHGGFLQYFTHKWNKAGMANSVEVRSPFLDKNVYLYLLSVPIEKKLNNGRIKSILKDAFKDHLPDYILNQNFKQGLPKDKTIQESDKKIIISEIINQKEFSENCWNTKKVRNDFKEKINLKIIWELCKLFLQKEGFKRRASDNTKPSIYLNEVPGLHNL